MFLANRENGQDVSATDNKLSQESRTTIFAYIRANA